MAYPVITAEDLSPSEQEKLLIKKKTKRVRSKRKCSKNNEYQKLRVMVPSIALNSKVSKITVIEEAVRYIDHLHVALLTKLQEKNSTSLQLTDLFEMKQENMVQFPADPPSRNGNETLELMKKADFSLYLKLRDQMEILADTAFQVSGNIKYIDGDFNVQCVLKKAMNFRKN